MIDLNKLKVETIDGKLEDAEFAKELARAIYATAKNLDEHELARQLFNDGTMGNTLENRAIVKATTKNAFPYFVQVALEKKLCNQRNI